MTLQVVTAAFAALMGLLAVFEAARAVTGAGNAAASWADTLFSVVAALIAVGAAWLARRGSASAASWLLIVTAALRVAVAAGVTAPASYQFIWPFYLIPIVIAQVLLGSRAGVLTALGAGVMFVFTYNALSGSPEIAGDLGPAVLSASLLYILVGVLVHIAISKMAQALHRSAKLVSSHERARTELREREEQFRALAESSATGIVIHQDGRLVYGNPHFFDMAQCPSDDCFGLSLWDFFDKADVERIQQQLARRRLGRAQRVEPTLVIFNPLKAGRRWCEVAVAEAEFWQKPAIVANLLDVTERVEAQLEVQRERDFSNNIINNADAVIMVVDAEGRLLLLNPAGQRLTGYTVEGIGQQAFWEVLCPEETRAGTRRLFFDAKAGGQMGQSEGPWLTRSGDEVTIAWRYVAQYDSQRELATIVAVGIDVTQQRMLERQATVTERLRSLGQVAGGVAHDLNNMLAGIMGPTDLLLLEESDPGRERALKAIMAAATRGAETVRRIQSFSKARTELDRQVFDLRELAEDVIFSLRPRWRDWAQKQGIRINVRDEVPAGITVHASAGEIGNVLMNLIVNACEAMEEDGEIVVTGRQDGKLIKFQVRDTGSGMPQETMENIFQPFYSTKGADNSGLGLAVIHGIILRHGGSITVDSVIGEGTTFNITLPASEEAISPSTAPHGSRSTAEMRILVVDDVPDIADYIRAIARRDGHSAESCYSGEEALTHLEAESYDLLVTDYGMEGISGIALAEKARLLYPDIKIALVTGWDVSEDEVQGLDAVLKKPCTRGQIQQMFDDVG
ncbi:MAG: PAS domain S-box protein [Armatimonadia bacterium]